MSIHQIQVLQPLTMKTVPSKCVAGILTDGFFENQKVSKELLAEINDACKKLELPFSKYPSADVFQTLDKEKRLKLGCAEQGNHYLIQAMIKRTLSLLQPWSDDYKKLDAINLRLKYEDIKNIANSADPVKTAENIFNLPHGEINLLV